MALLRLILCAVFGYLLGNIQTGLIVGRLKQNIDLRNHGSGSSGATNALRVLGRQSAALTLLGDCIKGIFAVGIGLIITGQYGGMLAALFVVIGHIWPVFYGFHGGKGAATSIGALAMLMPWQTLVMSIIAICVIVLTKTVSLGSMCGAVVFIILSAITALSRHEWIYLAFGLAMGILVIFAHRSNIDRLIRGVESKISLSMLKRKK